MGEKGVTVEIQGRPHEVPQGVTILQAYWSAGEELIHGVGCLGGVCGACTVTYRVGDPPQTKTGLGCQIPVQEGMSFSLFPIEIPRKRHYQLATLQDPQRGLLQYYPETKRCVSCRACTLVCPQEIDVMGGVLKAIHGELEAVAESFYNCVMCGLCAVVCDVKITPHLVGLYARRVVGRERGCQDRFISRRIREIEQGSFDQQWEEIRSLNEKELKEFSTRERV
jgi:Fe-S oxidoreductase